MKNTIGTLTAATIIAASSISHAGEKISEEVSNEVGNTIGKLHFKYPKQDIQHPPMQNNIFNKASIELFLESSQKVDLYEPHHYTDYMISEYKGQKYVTPLAIMDELMGGIYGKMNELKNRCIAYAIKNANTNNAHATDDVFEANGKIISYPGFDAEYQKCIK